ncbi:MAG: pantoate--beta-alanine ligase [bacterium]
MLIAKDIPALRDQLRDWRSGAERVGLVPTMGNLHKGHLSLVHSLQSMCDRVVVSIFVNPLQFDRESDLAAYPRTLERDLEQLESLGVDAVFTPSADVLYPGGLSATTQVEVPGISAELEGASRPGHFTGVSTVVCKLFNIVRPSVAIFGEKDFQQLLLIRKMVSDLDMSVRVESLATVREVDGLALSSRNSYLTAEQREKAPELYATLAWFADQLIARAISQGNFTTELEAIKTEALARLRSAGFSPDYLELRRATDLGEAGEHDDSLRLLAAAWLGKARLIDNIPVTITA